jgi:hypothetical protein
LIEVQVRVLQHRRGYRPGEALAGAALAAGHVLTWLEPVADVAECLDVGGVAWVWLDLRAKRRDAAIDAARRDDDRAAPDRVEDLVA